jgi:hypothetical protein
MAASCGSCSSGRDFASRFLSTPSHGEAVPSVNSSLYPGLQRTLTSKQQNPLDLRKKEAVIHWWCSGSAAQIIGRIEEASR